MAVPKRISKKELAALFQRDPRSITNYVHEGMPRHPDGTYPPAACVAWLVDREREGARAGKGLNDLDLARQRKTLAEARKAELEAEELEGRMVDTDVVEQRVRALVERVAARLAGLGRYRGDVLRAMSDVDADEVLQKIEDELRRACLGLADEIEGEAPPEDGDDDSASPAA